MQKLDTGYAESLYQEMRDVWLDTKDKVGPKGQKHMYHVEFGHYSSLEHFSLFEKYAVRNADSLGMNEVEMQTLIDYWNGDIEDINEEKSSHPDLSTVLFLTAELFKQAKEKDMPLSRVHLHPYGNFLICYDTNKWHNAEDAIVKSSMTLLKYCLRDNTGAVPDNWTSNEEDF